MPLNQNLKKDSNVLWTISVIQDQNPTAQTKSEFSEMANDVANTATIGNLTLCLADNLQRFRLMIKHGITEEEAIIQCQKLSEQWHIDNAQAVESLKKSKNFSILTWQEFLEWPDKDKTIADVEKLYNENKDFRNDVDVRVRQVRDSLPRDSKISSTSEQTALLKKYLIEECAFQRFAASKGFHYEIYKTQCCKAMRRIKNNTDFIPMGIMREVFFTQFDQKNKSGKSSPDPINRYLNVQNNGSILCGIDFPPTYLQKTTTYYPSENQIKEREKANKAAFSSVFSNPIQSTNANENKPYVQKVSEFIEKTLELIPPEKKLKATELLIKFTSQELIPLCYAANDNPITTVSYVKL